MGLTANELGTQLIERARERARDPRIVWGLHWGFPGIDRATGGIALPMLALVVGSPSVGKSAWAGQVAESVATELVGTDKVVRIVSLEMDPDAWIHRMACARAKVNSERIKTGFATKDQRDRYEKATRELSKLPIEFTPHTKTFRELYHELADDKRTAFWVLDHLGIVPGAMDPRNPTSSLIQVSGYLRELAHTVAPGLVLSQITKEFASRQDKRPQLSDVWGGMQVIGNADTIIGLYREDLYTRVSSERVGQPLPAEMLVLKNRDGSQGNVEAFFVPSAPAWVDKTLALEKLEAQMRRGE